MADWKKYINTGFSGCQRLAYARDHVRSRDVSIWLVPGERADVGISDGTDAWIAPVSADCFSVNVARLIADLEAGRGIPKPVPLANTGRRQLILSADQPSEAPAAPRRRLLEAPAATPSITQGTRRARLDV